MGFNPKEAAFVHGEYVRNVGGGTNDAYVAIVKSLKPEDNGALEIKIVNNPQVNVYVAKPQFRNNTVKKELEEKSHLDMYRCEYRNMNPTLWNAINNPGRWRTPPQFIHPKKILSNPYVYGADIDLGVHIKRAYYKANGNRNPLNYKIGFLDIETDVNGSEQIILITFMLNDGTTYVGILEEFYGTHTIEEAERLWKKKVEPDFTNKLNKKAQKIYEKLGGLKLNFMILHKETDLIQWIFSKIHEHKPDFMCIWNIDYDVPYILRRCQYRGLDPKNIFCSPEVPYQYRVCQYKPDPGKKDGHLVDRWPWLHCTAYTCWIDAMMLYGRLRKAKPREPSYKLDAIGGKEIGAGKLAFGDGESHSTMQSKHQVQYTIYNVIDVAIMMIMEAKNNDIRNMMMLIGVSTLDCFAHQSVQLKNYFYDYLDKKNCVPAAVGDKLDKAWDYLIKNKGGAVLDPSRAAISVPALKEFALCLRAARFVCDIDVSSMYPSFLAMLNCSGETKLATVLHIDNTRRRGLIKLETDEDKASVIYNPKMVPGLKNFDVNAFFSDAIYTEANAIAVGQRFNLPGFEEIDKLMETEFADSIKNVA